VGAARLTVDTTCGLQVTQSCPNDPATDGKCGLEEAVLALRDRRSENGCTWSGTVGSNNTIVIPTAGTFMVTTSLQVTTAVTFMSSETGTLATIQASAENNLFGVAPKLPVAITFQDLHLIGPGKDLPTLSSGVSISGETPDAGATIDVTRCWIEQFSNGGIVANDVNLNVTDSTIDSNSNDGGDGGGGIFFDTGGDARSQVDFLTVSNSSITRNRSTKGAGIHIQSNSVSRITNSTISDNLTDGGHGGGISFANDAAPLTDGVLRIVGSTIAFNGSTIFAGAGISVADNRILFPENTNNHLYVAGSVVANNCLAQINADKSFTCLSPSDVFGDIFRFQDSLLGSSSWSTILGISVGGEGPVGATFIDVDAGLDPHLTDQGGVGAHHTPVHMLNSNSPAIDAVEFFQTGDGAIRDEENRLDQTHQARGFDHLSAGAKTYDLGAVERRTNP
jgi:hypothetical protein